MNKNVSAEGVPSLFKTSIFEVDFPVLYAMVDHNSLTILKTKGMKNRSRNFLWEKKANVKLFVLGEYILVI